MFPCYDSGSIPCSGSFRRARSQFARILSWRSLCPFPSELQRPGLKGTRQELRHPPIWRHDKPRVIGVKVRYWMILLIPVHVDHDPVERADTRHDLTVSRSASGGKVSGMPRATLKRMPSSSEPESPGIVQDDVLDSPPFRTFWSHTGYCERILLLWSGSIAGLTVTTGLSVTGRRRQQRTATAPCRAALAGGGGARLAGSTADHRGGRPGQPGTGTSGTRVSDGGGQHASRRLPGRPRPARPGADASWRIDGLRPERPKPHLCDPVHPYHRPRCLRHRLRPRRSAPRRPHRPRHAILTGTAA